MNNIYSTSITLLLAVSLLAGCKEAASENQEQVLSPQAVVRMKVTPVSLLPDETRLRAALRSDVDDAFVQSLLRYYNEMSSSLPENFGEVKWFVPENSTQNLKAFMALIRDSFARPEQVNIVVHASSGKEIARYEEGSVAFSEFPGGARSMAELYLNPDVVFYALEYLEPGHDYGFKLHLLYWDGAQWSMVGPAWRALP